MCCRLRGDVDQFLEHAALGLAWRGRHGHRQTPRTVRACAWLGARYRRQGLANPIAELLSYTMLLRYSFDLQEDADLIEQAIQNVLVRHPHRRHHAGRHGPCVLDGDDGQHFERIEQVDRRLGRPARLEITRRGLHLRRDVGAGPGGDPRKGHTMGLRVAVVGPGAVGREMLTTLAERNFPADEVIALASSKSTGAQVPSARTMC